MAGRTRHVDAEDFAQKDAQVLAVALRVAAGAAITQAYIKKAVRAEEELAAIVVGERLANLHDLLLAGSIRRAATRIGRNEAGDDRAAGGRGSIIDVEGARGRVIRREREAEEPLLIPGREHLIPDIEKYRCLRDIGPVVEGHNAPRLFQDEDPSDAVRREEHSCHSSERQ